MDDIKNLSTEELEKELQNLENPSNMSTEDLQKELSQLESTTTKEAPKVDSVVQSYYKSMGLSDAEATKAATEIGPVEKVTLEGVAGRAASGMYNAVPKVIRQTGFAIGNAPVSMLQGKNPIEEGISFENKMQQVIEEMPKDKNIIGDIAEAGAGFLPFSKLYGGFRAVVNPLMKALPAGLKTAATMGLYEAAKQSTDTLASGGNETDALGAAIRGGFQGSTAGAAYHYGGKAFSNLTPRQIPFAERIGSGTGSALASLLLNKMEGSPQSDASVLTTGALFGLTFPTPRNSLSPQIKNEIVRASLNKVGIKPRSSDVKVAGDIEKFNTQSTNAIQDIYENKDKIQYADIDPKTGITSTRTGLPKSLGDLVQAIPQVKNILWTKIQAAYEQATNKGMVIDTKYIAQDLRNKLVGNKVLRDQFPEVYKYGLDMINTLKTRKLYTPLEAEEFIRNANMILSNYYKSPTSDMHSKSYVNSIVASAMRVELDNAVKHMRGSGVQELRNQYGDLKLLEKYATSSYLKHGSKSPVGLVDYFNVYNVGDILIGLTTGNPAHVVKGMARSGMMNALASVNHPDAVIDRMYRKIDALYNEKTINDMVSRKYEQTAEGIASAIESLGERGSIVVPGGEGIGKPKITKVTDPKTGETGYTWELGKNIGNLPEISFAKGLSPERYREVAPTPEKAMKQFEKWNKMQKSLEGETTMWPNVRNPRKPTGIERSLPKGDRE